MKQTQRNLVILSAVWLLFGCDADNRRAVIETARSSAALTSASQAEPSNQIPGELIVKFRSTGDKAVTDCVATRLEKRSSLASATTDQSSSLDALMSRFKVGEAEALMPMRKGLTTAKAKAALQSIRSSKNATSDEEVPDMTNIYRLRMPEDINIDEAVSAFAADPHVEYAQPNYRMDLHYTPNDPYLSSYGSWGQPFADLWNLHTINAETAWDTSRGAGVVVAVVDTGVDMTHPELSSNIWSNADETVNGIDDDGNGFVDDVHGWDFVNGDADPTDDASHGTHVAGIVAAEDNNNTDIVGVAPDVRVMPVKALSMYGGDTFTLSQGILYAAQNGARVINNSWGCTNCPPNRAAEDAIRYAHAANAVVVFSSGNNRLDIEYGTPAGYPYAITVSGSGPGDIYYDWSCYGEVDVAAPGTGIYDPTSSVYMLERGVLSLLASDGLAIDNNLIVGSDLYRLNGTSMAAPHVSGLAALILSLHPTYTPEMVRQVIRRTAVDLRDPGFDILFGYGRIDAAAAVASTVTPLSALITGPIRDVARGLSVPITGMATGTGFFSYTLEVGETEAPTSWTPIASSSSSVANGVLGNWSVPADAVGSYTLRLRVVNTAGAVFEDRQRVSFKDFFISSPTDASDYRAGTMVPIMGTAAGSDFGHYEIEITDVNGNPVTANIVGYTPVEKGLLGTWNTTGLANGEYDLTISMYLASGGWNTEVPVRVVIDPLLHPGWPVTLPASNEPTAWSNTTLADVNGDGAVETVLGYGDITVLKHDGTTLAGWPKKVRPSDPDAFTQRAPAVGDIDGDGLPEIVAGNSKGWIAAWNADGSLVPGYPLQGAPGNQAAVALEDIDRDGVVDIITDWGLFGVQVRRGNGQPLAGWSTLKPVGAHEANTPTAADLNGDGKMEIVVSSHSPLAPHLEPADTIAVFSAEGTMLPGFPKTLDMPVGHAVGDLDGDGDLEIVVTTHNAAVYAFHHDGSDVAGWPTTPATTTSIRMVNFPTVGDLDGDDIEEVLIGEWRPLTSILYALNGAGATLWSVQSDVTTDRPPRGFASSALVDLNNDGLPEIVTSRNIRGWPSEPGIAVYDASGTIDPALSRFVASSPSAPDTTPAFADTDGDSLLEMVWVGFPAVIYQWDLAVPATADAPWPMFQGNPRHTGYNIPSKNLPIPARIEAERYVRSYDTTSGNQGGGCLTGDNVDKAVLSGSNCIVGWTAAGEWLEYDIYSPMTQAYDIILRLASDRTGRMCRVEVDGVNVSGSIEAPSSGWNNYQNLTVSNIAIAKGDHTVRVFMETGLLNFDSIQFDLVSTSPPGTINLGPEHTQTPFTAGGVTTLKIDQLSFGWTPRKIVVGFGALDNQTLSGVTVTVNGTTTSLSGWWQTVSIPYSGQSQILLTVNAPSTRQLRAEWWAE